MKIYFNKLREEYGKNIKSGSRTFIDKFYNFMEKRGHTITNNPRDNHRIQFVLCYDDIDTTRKVVTRIDGMHSPACSPIFDKMNKPIINSVRQSDHVIFQSRFCLNTFKHFAGFTPKKYSFIFNGTDTNIFKPLKDKLFKNNILVYGEARRENCIMPAIKAIELIRKKIPDAELWIVGGGTKEVLSKIPDKPYIKKFGSIENFSLPVYADECSVMAFPTYKPSDHNSVSECLACGLPVVCYDSGGTHEKVGDAGVILKSLYYGWDYFPEEDPEEFAEAIIHVLNYKNVYFKRACARRDDLSLDKMAEKYIKVFEEVLNEKKRIN